MGALFGTFAAISIGLSDLFGRRVVAASTAVTAAVVFQLIGVGPALGGALLVPGEPLARDLALGALSGLGMGVGLSSYYGGLNRSSSTVVAPVVATLSAVIPFLYTLARGDDATRLAVGGALVAFGGLVLITVGGGGRIRTRTGLLWGIAAGLGYGFALAVLVETSGDSGSWPAVPQRLAAFGFLMVFAAVRGMPVLAPRSHRNPALMAGLFGGLTSVLFLIGVQADALPAVVTTSMFPAASVAIGWMFFNDHVSRIQAIGIAIVLLGVAGVVAG